MEYGATHNGDELAGVRESRCVRAVPGPSGEP